MLQVVKKQDDNIYIGLVKKLQELNSMNNDQLIHMLYGNGIIYNKGSTPSGVNLGSINNDSLLDIKADLDTFKIKFSTDSSNNVYLVEEDLILKCR